MASSPGATRSHAPTLEAVLRELSFPAAEVLANRLWGRSCGHSRLAATFLRDFIDANQTSLHIKASRALWSSAPLPLERWPRVTSINLNVDLEVDWEAEEANEERERARQALEVAPLLSLPLLGTQLAARQRITTLTISGMTAGNYGIPAVALSPLAFLLPNLKEFRFDGATLHHPDRSKPLGAHARQLHAALAAGAPHLEALTLPDAKWLEGVEALPGLKRVRVQPPCNSEDHGVLTPEAAVSLMGLRGLEELKLGANEENSPQPAENSPEAVMILLEALPDSMKHFECGEGSYNGLDGLDLTFQGGHVEKMSYRGCMRVLAEVAARLERSNRLGPRLCELILSLRTTVSPVLNTDDLKLEAALQKLRGSCEELHLDEVTLHAGADGEPGLAATLQALQLFGLPSLLNMRVGHLLSLRLNCAALAAAAQQAGGPPSRLARPLATAAGRGVADDQLPQPSALLHTVVQDLIAEGKEVPTTADSSAETAYGEEMGVLVARGSFVDGLPQDVGLLHEWLGERLRPEGGRANCAVQVLPPASALLIKCAQSRIGAVKAALEQAQAEAGGQGQAQAEAAEAQGQGGGEAQAQAQEQVEGQGDAQAPAQEPAQAQAQEAAQQHGGAQAAQQQAPGGGVVVVQVANRSGRMPVGVHLMLRQPLQEAVQSALDAAAPHLPLVACIEWLYDVRQAPLPLERWPHATSINLNVDLEVDWEAEEADEERERARQALEVAPLLSLPLLGTQLAARQRITTLTISGMTAGNYGIPAVALSPLAFLLPNLKELRFDGATLHRPDRSKPLGAHARQLHAALAAGVPHLEALTLPDAKWLEGLEALLGLKRVRVQPPCNSEDHGVLTPEAAVSLMGLRGLERFDTSEGSYNGLDDLDLTFQGGHVEKMSYRGCMRVLAEAAARLERSNRLGPRLCELRLSRLETTLSPVHDTADLKLEAALQKLRGSCEKLQLKELAVRKDAVAEPGLAATLQALELFGLPSFLTVGVTHMLDLILDCAALASEAQRTAGPRPHSRSLWGVAVPSPVAAGRSAAPHQPPEPLALLLGAVEGLIAEGKEVPTTADSSAETAYGEEMGVLVARGLFVDGLPQDVGLLREWLGERLRPKGGRANCAVQVLPPASALLIKCAQSRIPAVKAALEQAQAEAGGQGQAQAQGHGEGEEPAADPQEPAACEGDSQAQQHGGAQATEGERQGQGSGLVVVQTCNKSGCLPMCVNLSLHTRLEKAVQSALDAAAPHLPLVACIEWLYDVRQVLGELPPEVRL
ncbi:hypothetical protein HYH03_004612 [Edaphochlamys debaryana]|uniref:Uncharacterized protein n=1 Tax=Edaphochlamys debaryana TaxID=47281 RepID=A0A836C343_9CHLO|nr:hypothetical protein HYH03_004612 [Edaphochlamys debaryana]|eukprot:KAG2497457.1 hypothetical protein HYH03_004612 [Edaphochlamys debaryana]